MILKAENKFARLLPQHVMEVTFKHTHSPKISWYGVDNCENKFQTYNALVYEI